MDLASAVASAANSGATLRTGTAVDLTYTGVIVDVGGGQLVDAPRLAAYRPILGETVQLLQQGPLVIAVGGLAAMPTDNAVTNPSFETDLPGATVITGWTKYVTSGAATVRVGTADTWPSVDGNQVGEITETTSSSTTALLSAPIQVTYGQTWSASCAWQAHADGVSLPMVAPLVSLWLVWFATAAGAYPTTVAADSLVMQSAGPALSMNEWGTLRSQAGGGVVVPIGAGAMRVMLKVVHGSTGTAFFDRVTARRIT